MEDKLYDQLIHRLDKQDEILDRIFAQAMKTNGRVNSHDTWITAIKWTCGVLWTLTLVLVPILWHLQQLQSKQDSQDAVTAALSEFNINYIPSNN